jgi:hypothetical protein
MARHDWPELALDGWRDTYATVHMWTQVAGKIAVRHAVPENHSWAIAMQVTPQGLSTRTLYYEGQPFMLGFDFVEHRLVLSLAGRPSATLRLEPMTVADFYAKVMSLCREAGLPVSIWTTPVEIEAPIPFEQDTVHRSYDAAAIQRFHRALVQIDRVFREYRSSFVGKSSPSHFFWGSFDLAVTRFSGRPAPPREGPAFMREAYSHEVISHGFWPGGGPMPEPIFYSYAVPEPAGFRSAAVSPEGAHYHEGLGEFVLPYDRVRTSDDPERALRAFMDSTYERAATLAGWDRQAMEKV